MIHQFIFASPRPGMSEEAFLRYWIDVHAVRYAMHIPQIRRYMIDARIPMPGETTPPLWSGVAEIWLANAEEQLASLQTPEFLLGARADEPNWAAFWMTRGLDTTAHVVLPGPPESRDSTLVKLLILSKRREGLPLPAYKDYLLGQHAARVLQVPGLRRYVQGHVVEGFYSVGEAVLDCVEQLWFDSLDALIEAQRTMQHQMVRADYRLFTEERYLHEMIVRENWIIGPEPRPYTPPVV
jgi:uncharacterized protein (TIGR02118 family)